MRRTRRYPAEAEDTRAVERTRAALEAHLAEGGPGSAVSVAYVLDLLKPAGAGMWSFDPEHGKAALPAGDADPMTGCRPVIPAEGGPAG
jgi:hypothetical protein